MKTKKLIKRSLFVFKKNNFRDTKLYSSTTSDPTTITLTVGTSGLVSQ
jgi:hypothetical protein